MLITTGSLNAGGISGSGARLYIDSSVVIDSLLKPIECCFDLPLIDATLKHKETQKQSAKALTSEKATAKMCCLTGTGLSSIWSLSDAVCDCLH